MLLFKLIFIYVLMSISIFAHANIQEIKKDNNNFIYDFLPTEKAFYITAYHAKEGIIIDITLGEKVYLYDDKLSLELVKPHKKNLTSSLIKPLAEHYHDSLAQRKSFTLTVHQTVLEQTIKNGPFTLKLSYQGCSEDGICYQPTSQEFSCRLNPTALQDIDQEEIKIPLQYTHEDDYIQTLFEDKNIVFIVTTFFGFGLLLSLTPCVFPMIPILSSIIVRSQESMNAKKGFLLSSVYVLSMSFAYTLAGMITARVGENIQVWMQAPWVIGFFSLFFVILALSMFGLYELKMPMILQTYFDKKSIAFQSKGIIGIAFMGFISALIVGPCVAAPLAGALLYIAHNGNIFVGGSALFCLSLGMGTPLLFIGTSVGKWFPKPGIWMQKTNECLGIILLGVAIFMVSRILPSSYTLLIWSLFIMLSTIYYGALEPFSEFTRPFKKLFKGILFTLLIYGISLLIGFESGAYSIFKPFEKFTSSSVSVNQGSSPLNFKTVTSFEDLQKYLRTTDKIVMVDFYADWCVNCSEFESFTLNNENVKKELQFMELIQVDVTKNNEENKLLQKSFNIYGPPAILFFKDGKELAQSRIVGFKNANEFLDHLASVAHHSL